MTEILRTNIGITTHLMPTGSLVEKESIASLRAAFDECFEAGVKKIIIDMERVSSLTGEALEFLFDTQDAMVANGGQLSVIRPNALLKDIFRITDFGKYIEVKDVP